MKSILAVADGGAALDAVVQAAGHVAGLTQGHVDVLHVRDAMTLAGGGTVIASPIGGETAIPILMEKNEAELARRADAARQASDRLKAGWPQTRFVNIDGSEARAVTAYGRVSDLVVVGRPGADDMKPEPAHVPAAIFESARPVMVVPPQWSSGGARPAGLGDAVVAWNGTAQAARALGYAIPLLQHAAKVTILSVGKEGERPETAAVAGYLARHGIQAGEAGLDVGSGSARSRGRALLNHVATAKAGLLVMGAYGQIGFLRFLGLGGATGKVITGCPVPVLLAH